MLEFSTIPGNLEMSSSSLGLQTASDFWIDIISNKVLLLISIVWLLLKLPDLLRIAPQLLFSIFRARGSNHIEYNISASRMRNSVALAGVLPFCLIADRYQLYDPKFMSELNPAFSALAVLGVFILYILLRTFFFSLSRLKRMDTAYKSALKRGPYGVFVILSVIMLLSIGLSEIINLDQTLVKQILRIEIATVFVLSVWRSLHILKLNYHTLTSFLYLCGLELLPAAALAASTLLL